MIKQFTVEEINFLCIFGTQSRSKLISDISEVISDIEAGDPLSDHGILEIAQNTLNKVTKMSDEGFAALEFYPEYGDDEQGVTT